MVKYGIRMSRCSTGLIISGWCVLLFMLISFYVQMVNFKNSIYLQLIKPAVIDCPELIHFNFLNCLFFLFLQYILKMK